jgi:hypothetical protein
MDFLCSVESLELGESLMGTAPRADAWFMLEYPGRWANKAFAESEIPAEVKEKVNAQIKTIPEARWMLIKQPPTNGRGVRFFAALPSGNPPTLYKFQFNDYGELLDIDLAALAAGDAQFDAARASKPMFLVCTNGLRDQCCALHGTPVAQALSDQFGEMIWESTHHGGHRFAANFLHLPHGLSYGRLRPENAAGVIQGALDGRIALEHFRGRSIYDEPIQAGEILLRRELDLDAVDALSLAESEALPDGRWRLRFNERPGGRTHDIVVERQESATQLHLSCSDEKTAPMVNFHLLEHTTP